MINETTFSPIKQTLSFGNNACITGVIINPNNTPLTLQVIDWNYSSNPITIPPNSKFHFQEMQVRQIKLVSGQGTIIYSLDTKNLDVGIENVTVQNVNQEQTYLFKASYNKMYESSTISQSELLGFVITLPPNTGIKIKNVNIQASPIFNPSLVLASASIKHIYLSYQHITASMTFVTYMVTYTGNYGSFLFQSLFNNPKLCQQLKANNNYLFIENANVFLYLTSYSSTSILCGSPTSPKSLILSDNNFNFSTFNFTNTTMSFALLFKDNIPHGRGYTINWSIYMLIEPIPSYQKPKISVYSLFPLPVMTVG